MRGVTVGSHNWIAARSFLLDRSDDFSLQLTRTRESFDPEAIHDLRVSLRRLREGIAVFGFCYRKRQLAPLRKELKSFITWLGSIRNSDEAILFFTALADKSDAAIAAAVMNIVKTLDARRVSEQRKLNSELKKIDPGSLLGKIDLIFSNPRIFKPDASPLFQPVGEYLLEAITIREKPLQEILPDALKEENAFVQHRLRIAVKRFRYCLEFLAPFASSDYKPVYSSLKEYQEVLGRLHDLDLFSAMAGEMTASLSEGHFVKNIITVRRHMLFNEFLLLQASNPLDEMGNRVRGLL